ncbi:ubiquitin-conjugating enzyme/RWD-like protein [Globomyces pollinis-pini]|nr:ubiquitin-conjugating enzyme/RWD-like protein [Globomyces pollinis-pini]
MINIMSLKKKKQEEGNAPKKAKTTAAQIRIQKDMSELDHLPSSIAMTFPDPNDVFNFNLTIKPDDGIRLKYLIIGFYKGGCYTFTVKINSNYPHEPPKVLGVGKVYHPNIDLEGNVCLNILREDWKPVLNLNSVLVGMQYLFLEPNADDPLNKEAAAVLRSDRRTFESNVKVSMKGGSVNGISYDKMI